ncbi:flagellar filament capping protein FliD [Sulfurimonas sp. SWIR-19]|uniref:flagellar filament capping protein FliD n=1 Tax=Sulfurimonas sp. SWIR-19 TaxID=2878390 RepID=UPI001CF4F3A8|nr:flagellar filament capping protein FliD [Sulfurimonas sp. SWIR-19]UCN00494.1 flagellar filament capping protein FliD [Sulfurimonas sp. SWIR-19]
MAGNITSLGIGSGVLTADVIDQLKASDTAKIIDPIDRKIETNNQKQQSYDLLSSYMNSFKGSTFALSNDTLFDNKTVDVSGAAEVTVDAGANVDSFTLETVTLAKKDITKLGALNSKTTPIASAAGVLNLDINGTTYNINYDTTTTLESLTQSITDIAGTQIDASILETSSGAFSLVLSSKLTGANQAITITDTDDGTNGTGSLDAALFDTTVTDGYQKIQNGTDAVFKFNGITTTRSTNEISDLILGVTITLKTEGDISNVSINQDTQKIVDEMQMFVDNYNTLMTNLNDMTIFDKEQGKRGIFQGDSFVNGLKRDIASTVTSRFSSGSLMDYGIDIDRYGVMSFDSSVLESKLQTDSASVKTFFAGGTDSNGNTVTGFFTNLDDKVKQYTGYGGLLSNFDSGLTKDAKNLADAKEKAQASLDTRYEIMTKRFTAYDGIISRLNSQFSSLQQIISAQLNSNN